MDIGTHREVKVGSSMMSCIFKKLSRGVRLLAIDA